MARWWVQFKKLNISTDSSTAQVSKLKKLTTSNSFSLRHHQNKFFQVIQIFLLYILNNIMKGESHSWKY